MFTQGKIYKEFSYLKKYAHFNKYHTTNKNKQFDSLEDMQRFSTLCLEEIKDAVGKLNQQEQKFVDTINSFFNMICMHRTNTNLFIANSDFSEIYFSKRYKICNKAIIYSNRLIKQRKIYTKISRTKTADIERLANNDFVFTSPYFANCKNSVDTIKQIINSGIIKLTYNYGSNAYFFKIKNSCYGYLTLTDHLYNKVSIYDTSACESENKELTKHISRKIFGFENNDFSKTCYSDVPMFSQKDMKLGIAYHTVYFLRTLKKNKKLRDFYNKVLNVKQPEDFNKIMHIIFNPEFHIPKILAIQEPKEYVNFVHNLHLDA